MKTFEELGVSESIRKAIEELGFVQPMPVQEEVIPYLISPEGRDVIALAQTGTGKTAAFGIPLLERIDTSRRETQALVLSPTRELCLQITDDIRDFAKYMDGVHVEAVYGGASIEPQMRALKKGVNIIVATPGRLVDLMHRGYAHLEQVQTIVLDEADEMLNMGFSENINEVFESLPAEHSTLMFSATMSKEVERIAKKYLHDYREIVVGSRNEGAENVNHIYYLVSAKDKYLALKRIVDYYPKIFAIIFCRTKIETQEIADKLIRDGYNAESLHGDLSQQQRDLTMQKFRNHLTQLLVATDVAARGLDVDDLTHVINFGLPDDIENYTHRSGRTGRAGKKGTSISIVHIREKHKIKQIEQVIKKEFVRQSLPEPKEICGKQLYHVIDEIERVEVDEEQIAPFMADVQKRWAWLDKDDIVKRILSREFGRFLRYYASATEIEEVSESKAKGEGEKTKGKRKKGDHTAEEGYTRLFLSVSKIDGFFAKDIIKLINDKVKGRKVEIGRIDLLKNISFVEVAEEDADRVMKGLKGSRVKGREIIVDYADNPNHSTSSKGGDSKKKDRKKDRKREQYPTDFFDEPAGKKKDKKDSSRGKRGAARASREERGYTEPRGRKFKKEDWMKFLHPDKK